MLKAVLEDPQVDGLREARGQPLNEQELRGVAGGLGVIDRRVVGLECDDGAGFRGEQGQTRASSEADLAHPLAGEVDPSLAQPVLQRADLERADARVVMTSLRRVALVVWDDLVARVEVPVGLARRAHQAKGPARRAVERVFAEEGRSGHWNASGGRRVNPHCAPCRTTIPGPSYQKPRAGGRSLRLVRLHLVPHR